MISCVNDLNFMPIAIVLSSEIVILYNTAKIVLHKTSVTLSRLAEVFYFLRDQDLARALSKLKAKGVKDAWPLAKASKHILPQTNEFRAGLRTRQTAD